jgi:hypothetical protein
MAEVRAARRWFPEPTTNWKEVSSSAKKYPMMGPYR